jgi:hypothetical protein
MRDVRGAQRREEEFYRRNPIQYCRICGRPFIRRPENTCSIACAERAQQLDADAKDGPR